MSELTKFKALYVERSSSISHFEKSDLEGNNLIIISADTDYDRIPGEIREKIFKNKYESLDKEEYMSLKMGEATILIKCPNKWLE